MSTTAVARERELHSDCQEGNKGIIYDALENKPRGKVLLGALRGFGMLTKLRWGAGGGMWGTRKGSFSKVLSKDCMVTLKRTSSITVAILASPSYQQV